MSIRTLARFPMQALCLLSVSASMLSADIISAGTASFNETLPFSNTSTFLTGYNQYGGTAPLEAIEFVFDTNVTGTSTVTDGPGPTGPNPTQDVTLNFAAALSIWDPTNTTMLFTTTPTASTMVTVPGDGTPVMGTATASGVMTTETLTNPALFAPFIGTGTFSLPIGGNATAGFSPNLIIPFTVSDHGSANGTVEVLFEAVPEPATGGLVLLAGLGLAVVTRFRRGKARRIWL